MKAQIRQFVAACTVCQQAKTERVPYPGLLQPLEVPTQAWQVVTFHRRSTYFIFLQLYPCSG